ncbi:hypothetical protein C8T65DRAFT_182161 [Cerioporus squamosus]|nr:hypothetical protein C8T65DRAFT_182161 [Cerioporus squamosus]
MRLRSPLAALTAAILNAASPNHKRVPDVLNYAGIYDEGSGNTFNENLSASMISVDQLFDMELKPTLKLTDRTLGPQSTLQSHDALMDVVDDDFDDEELDLDEDEIFSIDSPLTPDDTDTGAFLLTAFQPFSDEQRSYSNFLSQLPQLSASVEDAQAAFTHNVQRESGADGVIPDKTALVTDYRSCEIEMAKKYISDIEHGKTWEGTARQGLRPRKDRQRHILDEAPSNRPDAAPLSLLLIENRFATAVNRAYMASGDTYQPFPEYRFPLGRDPIVDFGVRRSESGSLHEIRVEHARVVFSRLLPFHPWN